MSTRGMPLASSTNTMGFVDLVFCGPPVTSFGFGSGGSRIRRHLHCDLSRRGAFPRVAQGRGVWASLVAIRPMSRQCSEWILTTKGFQSPQPARSRPAASLPLAPVPGFVSRERVPEMTLDAGARPTWSPTCPSTTSRNPARHPLWHKRPASSSAVPFRRQREAPCFVVVSAGGRWQRFDS